MIHNVRITLMHKVYFYESPWGQRDKETFSLIKLFSKWNFVVVRVDFTSFGEGQSFNQSNDIIKLIAGSLPSATKSS